MSLFETAVIESCRSRRPQLRHLMPTSPIAAFDCIKFPPCGFFFSFRSTLLLLLLPFCSSPSCSDLHLFGGPPSLSSSAPLRPPPLSSMVSSFLHFIFTNLFVGCIFYNFLFAYFSMFVMLSGFNSLSSSPICIDL